MSAPYTSKLKTFDYKYFNTRCVSLNTVTYEAQSDKKRFKQQTRRRWAGGGLTYNKVIRVCVCTWVFACVPMRQCNLSSPWQTITHTNLQNRRRQRWLAACVCASVCVYVQEQTGGKIKLGSIPHVLHGGWRCVFLNLPSPWCSSTKRGSRQNTILFFT